ncbi:MAG: Bax inhibitor-1 family protein [Gemmataceae bacterium]|nr:Bax inhibitor-1 family protein [Gemmataceae bacterium]
MSMDYAYYSEPVAQSAASERARFIRLTYLHVGIALLAFVGILAALFQLIPEETLRQYFQARMGTPVLVLMLLFVGVGMAADWLSLNTRSRAIQYFGLGLGVLLEAFIVFPLLYIAARILHAPDLIQSAAIMSLFAFSGLTIAALMSGKDFSFLRTFVVIGGFAMMGLIITAIFVGFQGLGLWIGLLGIGLTCITILYQTSNVMHRYRPDQYVGASLALFSSLATLFYYILYVLIQTNRSR